MNQDDFQDHVIDVLARLDTHMSDLVGNGQPGRVQKLETSVEELKKARWTLGGMIIGVSTSISTIIHFLFK
jgi:hypothetical protein